MILDSDLNQCVVNKLSMYIFYQRNLVNKPNSGSSFLLFHMKKKEKLKFIKCEYLPFSKYFSYLIIIAPIASWMTQHKQFTFSSLSFPRILLKKRKEQVYLLLLSQVSVLNRNDQWEDACIGGQFIDLLSISAICLCYFLSLLKSSFPDGWLARYKRREWFVLLVLFLFPSVWGTHLSTILETFVKLLCFYFIMITFQLSYKTSY